MTGKQISESDCVEDFRWPSSITSIRTAVESPECDDNSKNDALKNDSFQQDGKFAKECYNYRRKRKGKVTNKETHFESIPKTGKIAQAREPFTTGGAGC